MIAILTVLMLCVLQPMGCKPKNPRGTHQAGSPSNKNDGDTGNDPSSKSGGGQNSDEVTYEQLQKAEQALIASFKHIKVIYDKGNGWSELVELSCAVFGGIKPYQNCTPQNSEQAALHHVAYQNTLRCIEKKLNRKLEIDYRGLVAYKELKSVSVSQRFSMLLSFFVLGFNYTPEVHDWFSNIDSYAWATENPSPPGCYSLPIDDKGQCEDFDIARVRQFCSFFQLSVKYFQAVWAFTEHGKNTQNMKKCFASIVKHPVWSLAQTIFFKLFPSGTIYSPRDFPEQ